MNDPIKGVGDRGQRYEVLAKNYEGKEVTVGYTNDKTGGGIVAMIQRSAALHTYRVKDRFPGIEQFVDFAKFKAGCRKCVSEVYAGHDHCRYCSTRFSLAGQLTN